MGLRKGIQPIETYATHQQKFSSNMLRERKRTAAKPVDPENKRKVDNSINVKTR